MPSPVLRPNLRVHYTDMASLTPPSVWDSVEGMMDRKQTSVPVIHTC